MNIPGWREPVDPWPDAPTVPFGVHDGHTSPIGFRPAGVAAWTPEPAPRRRTTFGRVYELFTRDQAPGTHVYVGKTEQTLHQRVHGPSGHTSPADMAANPWKAAILPGKAGYRLLETVYDTGDPDENARALRRAEAFWIDRLRPTENRVRPVRPPATEPQPHRAVRPPSRAQVAAHARARRERVRLGSFLVLALTLTVLAGRMIARMELPWPAAPWIAGPILGLAVGGWLFFSIDKALRKVRGRRR